jgi:molecular chaperone HtpG
MNEAEMIEALGTIARSGTKAFMERVASAKDAEGAQPIGQFGVGFYSAFMVADKVDVFSRRAGGDTAAHWSSDGLGTYSVEIAELRMPPRMAPGSCWSSRKTRPICAALQLRSDHCAQSATSPCRSSGWRSPMLISTRYDAALTKPKSEISEEDYTDFYRSVAGQFDKPALRCTIGPRVCTNIPSSPSFRR